MTTPIDVLCVGDLDLDLMVMVNRLPGLDEKVSGKSSGLMPGGMSANAAVALARLGKSVALVACVGDDENGKFALASVAAEGVDITNVIVLPNTSTFTCLVMLTPPGEKALIRIETPAYLPRVEHLYPALFSGVRHVHLTFGDPALTERAVAFAKANEATISLDLEAADVTEEAEILIRVLADVDILFVNRDGRRAAEDLLGAPLLTRLPGPGIIIFTLGADGSRYMSTAETFEAPAIKINALDTTGAGDCFAAAFIARYLEGASPQECLSFANAAAGLSTAIVGAHAGMPYRARVETMLLEQGKSS